MARQLEALSGKWSLGRLMAEVTGTRRTGPYTRYRVNLDYFEFFAFPH
jgi:hypothetical protein